MGCAAARGMCGASEKIDATRMRDLKNRFRGLILGTAVGDALGLPGEGLSRSRLESLFKGRWRHRFLINRGMVSDDTDHTVFVSQCLLAWPDSSARFERRLAWCLRFWLLSLPAGIGHATLKSILRLCAGFSPRHSGVFSAGNGPGMRAAPIGAFFRDSPEKLDEYIHASTVMTHTDPKALVGARAIAYLAAWIVREDLEGRPDGETFLQILRSAGPHDSTWLELVESVSAAIRQDFSVGRFAESIGQSQAVTGYIYHTVPVVVYAWYRHFGDFEQTLQAVLDCGGDTDTVGAIVGALSGCLVGEEGIPTQWVEGIWDWPRGVNFLTRLADRLAEASQAGVSSSPVRYFWPAILARNAIFIIMVLLHGFRRLFPPY